MDTLASGTLSSTGRFRRRPGTDTSERDQLLAEARLLLHEDVPAHVAFLDDDVIRIIPLRTETTHIGRMLSADIRFDDPTVSRRHALLVQRPDGLHLLDDRSLNGVFVDGVRVTDRLLCDGDELVVGRHRLIVLLTEGVAPTLTDTRLTSRSTA